MQYLDHTDGHDINFTAMSGRDITLPVQIADVGSGMEYIVCHGDYLYFCVICNFFWKVYVQYCAYFYASVKN